MEEDTIDEAQAFIETYQAGFLDGYSAHKKPKTDEDLKLLNKLYRKAFVKRFESKVKKLLKKR